MESIIENKNGVAFNFDGSIESSLSQEIIKALMPIEYKYLKFDMFDREHNPK